MEEIRSFIAIEIPLPLQEKMGDLQTKLKSSGADVKWVRPGNIHLTLKFLGSVAEETINKVAAAVSPIIFSWESFVLKILGLGCFPSLRNPRVLWLGIEQGSQRVSSLQKVIAEKIKEFSFSVENRPFTPHLTIGRVRSPQEKEALIKALVAYKDLEVGSFPVAEIFLFQSQLKPSGPIYSKLRAFPLKESQE